jgi:hypothetical protein
LYAVRLLAYVLSSAAASIYLSYREEFPHIHYNTKICDKMQYLFPIMHCGAARYILER